MSILPSLVPSPFRGGLLPRIARWWRRRRCRHVAHSAMHDRDGRMVATCDRCGATYAEARRG